MQNYISYEIMSKDFSNKVSKKAYLDCCKWLAIKIFGNKNFADNVSVKINKLNKTKIPTFRVTVFADISYNKANDEFCGKCRTLHSTFYSIDKMNCDECKHHAYIKQNERYVSGIVKFYKELLEDETSDD